MTTLPPPGDWRTQRRVLREQARLERTRLRALRRQSIIGPVLLVGAGVVFLLVETGKLSRTATFFAFARYWPVLLIGAGLVRLAEWFVDRRDRQRALSSGQIFYPRTTGFGSGFAIVAILVLGVAAVLASRTHLPFAKNRFAFDENDLHEFFGDKHETDHASTHACPPGSTISIRLPHGDLEIDGTSTDGLAHLTAHNVVYSSSDDEALRRERQLTPVWDGTDTALNLSVPQAEGSRVDLVLSLPAGTVVTAVTDHGDIHVRSIAASVTVTANHGDIDLDSLGGRVAAHGNNASASVSGHALAGPVTVEGRTSDVTLSDAAGSVRISGDFFGTVHLERAAGPIEIHTSRVDLQFASLRGELELTPNADLTADQLTGPLLLNTRNRNISLDQISGNLTINNSNGSVSVIASSPLGSIGIENRNGPVDLTLPENANATFSAETVNGNIESDFSLPVVTQGSRSHLSGTLGHGGAAIHVATSQADIEVHKGGSSDGPSTSPAAPQSRVPPLTSGPRSRSAHEPTLAEQ